MQKQPTTDFKFNGFEEVTSATHGAFYSSNTRPASIRVPTRAKVGFFFRCGTHAGVGMTFTSGSVPITVLLASRKNEFSYYETPFSVDKGSIIHVSAPLRGLDLLGIVDVDYPKPKIASDTIVPLDLGYLANIEASPSGEYTSLKARAIAVDYFQDKPYTSLEILSSTYGQGLWYKGFKYMLHEGRIVLADLDEQVRVELTQRNSILVCYRNKYENLKHSNQAIVPVFN